MPASSSNSLSRRARRSPAVLTRRVLLSSAGLAGLAIPAIAAPTKQRPGGGKPAAKPAPTPPEPTSPAQTPVGPVDTAARWAVIIDFNTGATLLDKDADVRMPPSSMTKLMTAYIVYAMLKAGRLKLDQMLPVSERAWRMGGSKMFVQVGSQVKVEDLIRGMIVQSGNDACLVLAEAIAGSEEQFVELMNQKAKELGLTNSHFENCTGWPADNHYMSARDIATLARDIIRDFPEDYKYDSERSFTYGNAADGRAITQQNRNPLVQKGLADGLKTGHTEAGGYGLCASAERNGRRVVVVLNGMSTMHQRSEEGERLLEWA
ncbi:MAG TPA: D-alanyl-D-alanine carboxypeptidase family protein, partial [Acetobacteraceae bacterium]|nr:D-alanyl-D-alanine carboxypeptidase family protein [Acetobacteraceae bacterium]